MGGFSAIIAEKNSPQKNFGSRENLLYYHFYYYNGVNYAVFLQNFILIDVDV